MASTSAQESELSTALLEHSHDVKVNVNRHGQCCRLSMFIVCVILALLGLVWLVSIVISQWKEQTSYRLWLVLGLMSYASVLVYKGWGCLLQFGEETVLMQVTIKSTCSFTLYHAVCQHVATSCGPHSKDMEAGLEYDATFGRSIVKLGFWGRRGKTVRMNIMSQARSPRPKTMFVTQIRNADILTGRDHQPTIDDCLVLRLWSNDSNLEHDASLARRWLQTCVQEHLKQPKEQVQIYRPLQRWREEEADWTLYRTRRAPSASTTGPIFYISRKKV